jgi:F-type H+-transporting ATPase subunit epsilon
MPNHIHEPTLGEAAYRVLLPSEVTELEDLVKGKVRVTIVTPERAVLDAVCEMVILPMFDGELGVLPGRAALIGRLGSGELRLRTGNAVSRMFVDGGFAQVRNNVISILTPRAIPVAEITAEQAARAQSEAEALPSTNPVERATRQKAQERARGMARIMAKQAATH